MTFYGFVLGNGFINNPRTAVKEGMLCEYAQHALLRLGASGLEIADRDTLATRMKELNDNGTTVFVVLSADYAVADGLFGSDFSVTESTRLVGKDGGFAGALLTAPADYEAMLALTEKRVIDAVKITPQSFYEIAKKRRDFVRISLNNVGVYVGDADVSPLAEIGEGTFIADGCCVTGNTVIGKNCVITGASRIESSVIGDNTTVTSGVILNSQIGSDVSAGPFCFVRPGSVVSDGVKIGDFVEIKNSKVGKGTKISHLTYVGDSDVGGGVNFGCGTVTVNYDGISKHRTVIGDNVFIGCNANLVAPVSVGDNAFIAAGSTITEDIPDRSFAIARARQTTKENYVERKMPDMIKKQ